MYVRTDTHGDTVNELVDSLYDRPALHLASIIAAHLVAPALDVSVGSHLLVRVEALAPVREEAGHELAQHLPHEKHLFSVGVVVELDVVLVQKVLDREAAALEVGWDIGELKSFTLRSVSRYGRIPRRGFGDPISGPLSAVFEMLSGWNVVTRRRPDTQMPEEFSEVSGMHCLQSKDANIGELF